MIDKIRDFMKVCPYLKEGVIGVDYLSNGPVAYSIEPIPTDPIITKYVDGSSFRQLTFVLASREAWGADVINNLLNCKVYDDVYNWIEEKNNKGELPDISGIESIECTSTGYAYQVSETEARYQIQMRVTYKK